MRLRLIAAALAATGLVAGCGMARSEVDQTATTAKRVPLEIRTAKGVRRFRVEVARTSIEQQKGLMFRTSLPKDGGMIFPFDTPRPASFWMKNTPLPLDLLFIRTDGTIARIAANAVPFSEEMVTSGGETVGSVLELEGGKADALGIAEGDRVIWDATAQ